MIKDISIVGGGTSGLIAALILKNRFNNLKIQIIKSDKIGIIGVGEGSTEHWQSFMDFCQIDYLQLLKETGATFKYGVLFDNWTEKKYFHHIVSPMSFLYGQYLSVFSYAIANNYSPKEYTYLDGCLNNRVMFINQPTNQYHFNTFKLNKFLLKKCREKNINIIEDEINEVILKDNKIKKLIGNKKEYTSDFFIDSTGFKKLLISKLGAKWISYKEHLPLNEAIAFPTDDTSTYTPYTLARAMKAGWMWRIPTQGRWGNGYVFNNKYINAEQAKQECENYLGHNITIAKNIKFEAGSLDKTWIENCVAIGLSSSFVEPLEATSIGMSIQQTFLLMHLLPNYNLKNIEKYNLAFKEMIENVRDFIVLHYLVNKKDSKFWRDLKLNIPSSLKHKLKIWKNRLPIRDDFLGSYNLFYEANWTLILKELGFINKDTITKEFNFLSEHLQLNSQKLFDEHLAEIKPRKAWIDHKKYLGALVKEC
tara:strand:- start:830 stop:2266 length:1437 start_codon:yes stop_codon:yes gene_type:complete